MRNIEVDHFAGAGTNHKRGANRDAHVDISLGEKHSRREKGPDRETEQRRSEPEEPRGRRAAREQELPPTKR